MNKILVKKVRAIAKVPFKSTSGSAGFDVCAAISESITIKKETIAKIPSGIAICLPKEESVALLMPRSGLSINEGITLANAVGVIDSDFRGEIIVALKNFSNKDYILNPGEKIAQLLFFNLAQFSLEVTQENLPNTLRGTGGLGSTGKN